MVDRGKYVVVCAVSVITGLYVGIYTAAITHDAWVSYLE